MPALLPPAALMLPAIRAPAAVRLTGAPGALKLLVEPPPCALTVPTASAPVALQGHRAGLPRPGVDGGPAVRVDAARDVHVAACDRHGAAVAGHDAGGAVDARCSRSSRAR